MATNYDTLKAHLQDLAEELEDPIAKTKALILIDQYIAALQAAERAASSDILSYSIGGQSVTRARGEDASRLAAGIERDLYRLLYGMYTTPDWSGYGGA